MTKTFKDVVVRHIKTDRPTLSKLGIKNIAYDYTPLIIRSPRIPIIQPVRITRTLIKDLQDIHKLYVSHVGIDVNNPENTWIGKPLMFLLGKKKGIISELHLIKTKQEVGGCSYMVNISPNVMAKSLYELINKGFQLGGLARVVLCRDKLTDNDDHIFGKIYKQRLTLVSLTTGGFSIKVPDEERGGLVKTGYKIV